MKYENTGNFTVEQKRIASRMRKVMSDARKAGLVVLAKCDHLSLFLRKDYAHSTVDSSNSGFMLKELDGGRITDAGADDQEYFETGYVTE